MYLHLGQMRGARPLLLACRNPFSARFESRGRMALPNQHGSFNQIMGAHNSFWTQTVRYCNQPAVVSCASILKSPAASYVCRGTRYEPHLLISPEISGDLTSYTVISYDKPAISSFSSILSEKPKFQKTSAYSFQIHPYTTQTLPNKTDAVRSVRYFQGPSISTYVATNKQVKFLSRATFSSKVETRTANEAVRKGIYAKFFGAKTLPNDTNHKKSQTMLMYLLALVVAMVGGTYAAVPLYRKFCQATGFGGTVKRREAVEEKIARHGNDELAPAREVVVHFNADVADNMPWKFAPCQREVRVKPGDSSLAFYTAENTSSEAITGVSTYNVTPMKAGMYFNKIQCFCFEEQRLRAGEKIDMPVLFYIDPEFADDPKMNDINSLILSYTFFKVEEEEEEEEEE